MREELRCSCQAPGLGTGRRADDRDEIQSLAEKLQHGAAAKCPNQVT